MFGRMGGLLAAVLALLALPCATAAASDPGTPTSTPGVSCPVQPVASLGCPSPDTGGSTPANSGATSPTTASSTKAPPPDEVLSNELSFTEFAYVKRISNVYAQPSTKSRRISRLQWYTEDGFSSIYLLLRAHWNKRTEWIKIRIPGRPNGRTGWVQRNALARFHLTHDAVVVNRERMRMTYYRNGHAIWNAPVGVGARSMPTPKGHFWINERFVITNPSDGYYPYAFGTTDYSTLTDWPGGGVVGIHGPYGAPASAIPGRISHGCIRLRIRDDFWLGKHLQMGTPVRVV